MAETSIAIDRASVTRRTGPLKQRWLVSTLSVLVCLAAWEIAPRIHVVDPMFSSRPTLVLTASAEIFRNGSGFVHDVAVSFAEFASGLLAAIAVGVPFGLLLGTFAPLRYLVDPPVMALYATPQLALLPILVLWLGVGMESKVAVAFVGAVIPIIVNSIAGVREVERSLVLAARSFGARTTDVFLKVILPASMPAVMTGIRLGVSRAILGVIVAEMYVSQAGIGHQIMRLGSAFRVDLLLLYVLLVSGFGFAMTAGIRMIEERMR